MNGTKEIDNRQLKGFETRWEIIELNQGRITYENIWSALQGIFTTCECGLVMRSVASVCLCVSASFFPIRGLSFERLDLETSFLILTIWHMQIHHQNIRAKFAYQDHWSLKQNGQTSISKYDSDFSVKATSSISLNYASTGKQRQFLDACRA